MRERERDLKLSNTKFAKTEFDVEKSGFCHHKSGEAAKASPQNFATSHGKKQTMLNPSTPPTNEQTTKTPLVSVIAPLYNAERFLPRLVECLKAQTLRNIEFILVDDGSSDATFETAVRLSQNDLRFRVLTQPNAGADAARKAGLKAANGEWVGFVDQDDYFSGELFSHLLELALTYKSDISCCEFEVVEVSEFCQPKSFAQKPFSVKVWQSPQDYLQDLFLAELNFTPYTMPWAKLFSKKLVAALEKTPTADGLAEDFVMNVAFGLGASRVVKSDKICYAYVRHQGSMSHKYTPKHLQCLEENYEKISTLLQDLPSLNGLFTQMKRCRLALIGAYMALMGESFSKQEKRRSLRLLRSELGYIFKSKMAFKGKILALLLCVCPKLALFLLKHTPRKR